MLPERTTKTNAELKEEYVKYFTDVPVQKYAAMYIGRDEDTIIRWRKDDKDFADAVQRAKSEWVRKKMLATKSEFALERLEREVFGRVDEAPRVSTYQQFINTHQIDPNAPEARNLAQETLDILMEKTRRKSSIIP